MAFGLFEGALGTGLLTRMVARRSLIKCVTFFFEFLPRPTWALVVALAVPTTLQVTGLDLFM